MKLAIIRHGQAQPISQSDAARPLTETGQTQAQQLSVWIQQQIETGILQQPQLIASPYVRAQQTAQAIAEQSRLVIDTLPGITPEGRPQAICEQLMNQTCDLVLVSHQPLVGCLASFLCEGQALDQGWGTAECRLFDGDIVASGCMTQIAQWIPQR